MPRKHDFSSSAPKGMVLDVMALTGGDKIRRIHSDNGGEFINAECEACFKTQGMLHTTAGAHAPQQNGIAVRRIGIVVLGKERWTRRSIRRATSSTANPPAPCLDGNTPYHELHGQHARMEHLRVFGCRVLTQVP